MTWVDRRAEVEKALEVTAKAAHDAELAMSSSANSIRQGLRDHLTVGPGDERVVDDPGHGSPLHRLGEICRLVDKAEGIRDAWRELCHAHAVRGVDR